MGGARAAHGGVDPRGRDAGGGVEVVGAGERAVGQGEVGGGGKGGAAGEREGAAGELEEPGGGEGGAGAESEVGVELEGAASGQIEETGGGATLIEGEDAALDVDGAGVGEREIKRKGAGGDGLAQDRARLVVEVPRAADVKNLVVLKVPQSTGKIGEGFARAGEDQIAGGRKIDDAGIREAATGECGVARIRNGERAAGEDMGGARAAHGATGPSAAGASKIQIARAVDGAVGQGQIVDGEGGIQRGRPTIADGRAFHRAVGHTTGIPISR